MTMKKYLYLCFALLLAACGPEVGQKYTYYADCGFEFPDAMNYCDADSTYIAKVLAPVDGLEFKGLSEEPGFVFSLQRDPVSEEGHAARPYAAFGRGGYANGGGYVVYQDIVGAKVPHTVTFIYPTKGTCALTGFFVNNTNEIVNLARFGNDVCVPFQPGDYLKLTVTGYVGDKASGTLETMLVDFTGSELKLVDEWTAVKCETISNFQYLDFSLSSNRQDIPLRVCIDDLVAYIDVEF